MTELVESEKKSQSADTFDRERSSKKGGYDGSGVKDSEDEDCVDEEGAVTRSEGPVDGKCDIERGKNGILLSIRDPSATEPLHVPIEISQNHEDRKVVMMHRRENKSCRCCVCGHTP